MQSIQLPVSYQHLSLAAATLCFLLFVTLLVFPGLVYWLFGLPSSDSADFMSRRAAILFLGLATITFASRNEPNTNLRRTLALAIAILMGGLAGLGMIEFFRGAAGPGIWLAIIAEALFAAAYFQNWSNRSDKA